MRRVVPVMLCMWLIAFAACSSKSTEPEQKTVATEAPASEPVAAAIAASPLPTPAAVEESATPEPEPPPPPPPPPPVAQPVRLQIPKIRVDAHIVPVGVNAYGEMDSPRDAWSVAWYAPGFKPSEPGNAVMAAHVDYINVGPAVFWNLKTLVPGDRILVTAADNQVYEFEVKETGRYTPETAPLDRIFGPNPNKGLNLVTCTGTFDSRSHEYDQRVVVYAEVVRALPPLWPNRGIRDDL